MDKPKMLFVDDRSKRIHYALENYSNEYDITIAPNVLEALRQLSAQDWDLVDLDHDLTGCDFESPDTPTCGMEIVRYIEKTGWPDEMRKRPVFRIHSSNLFAGHLITTRLQAMGFQCSYQKIVYAVEHMKYDKDGLPK